jgi:hypothetical protein
MYFLEPQPPNPHPRPKNPQQDGKLSWEMWFPNTRRPSKDVMQRSFDRSFKYNDRVGVLVDRGLRRIGFTRNGLLLPELTVFDLPLDRPCRFIASLYEAGAELIFTDEQVIFKALKTLDHRTGNTQRSRICTLNPQPSSTDCEVHARESVL